MRGSPLAVFWLAGLALSSACGGGDGGGGASPGGGLDSGEQDGGSSADATPDSTRDGAGPADAGDADADASFAPTCSDGIQNGAESDVDCGGACTPCAPGSKCQAGTDCDAGICIANVCAEAKCDDGVENGSETDVDCGGSCSPCAVGKGCGTPADCSTGVCKAGSCWDAACGDDTKNGSETDVDCGGDCPGCDPGEACGSAGDCSSKNCDAGICAAPTCSDAIVNGTESDVDCGGTCSPCEVGKACSGGFDCVQGVCTAGQCVAATCGDGTKNATETGVDCGGGSCPQCPAGGGCKGAPDCESGVCTGGSCAAATCTDAVQNAAESDVDCGGGTCPACATGEKCSSGSDCTDGVCVGGVCSASTCSDGVQNGAETDVDCGSACAPCTLGGACSSDADCVGSSCFYGACENPAWGLRAARAYESGVGPLYAAIGDLDGDGLNDVVALNSGVNAIAVLLNQGGVLAPPSTQYAIPTGGGPKRAFVTDLDGDGDNDVVVYCDRNWANPNSTIATFLNSGNGALTFADERSVNYSHTVLAVGDINGDSHPDVIESDSIFGVGWLQGNGDGTLSDVVWGIVPKPYETDFVLADFRKTGHLDIVTGNPSYTSSTGYLYPNDGAGNFGTGNPVPPSGEFGEPLVAADFTGDGKLDLLVRPEHSETISVFAGDDTGNFIVTATGLPVEFVESTRPQAADMDGDGDLDLVASVGGYFVPYDVEPTLEIWENDGVGRFSAAHAYRSGNGFSNFWLGDLDGNGSTDVLLAVPGRLDPLDPYYDKTIGANLRVLLNAGNGTLITAPPIAVTPRGPNSQNQRMLTGVTLGDLDGDDDLDIVACSAQHSSVQTFILENGEITGGSRQALNEGVSLKPYDCVIGDFDGDGAGDVAAVGTKIRIFLSRGRGLLDPANTITTASGIRAAAGDLNGDGLDDLVLAQNGGTSPGVAVLLAIGQGNFGPMKQTGAGKVEHVSLADLDGDGDLDVSGAVYGTFDPFSPSTAVPGSAKVLYNNGGVLSSPATLQTGDHPTATVAGDFDADGALDVAVANGESHDVTIFRRTGTSFTKLATWPVLVNPSDIAAGDLNGDGRTDLAVATFSSSAVSILLNTGAGKFERRNDYEAGDTSTALAVGDVDHNGMPDVVVASDAGMPILMNLATSALVKCQPGQPSCDGNLVRVCNAQGDGFVGAGTLCGTSQTCSNGACIAQICAPQTTSCDSVGNSLRCTLDGLAEPVVDDCQADEYCDPQQLGCQKMVCTPGGAGCVDDAVGTCNANGSGLEIGATSCDGATQVCGANACVTAPPCTTGTTWCFDGDIWQCKQGVRSLQYTCPSGTYCPDASPGCYAPICSTGQQQCVGDMIRTCNGDGNGWTYSPMTDCHTLGKVCVNGACSDEDVVTVWPNSSPSTKATPTLWTTYVDMETSRLLTEFAYKFSVPTDTQVHFVVYSSDSSTSTYTKIWDEVQTVTAAAGFDYHSTGPIGLRLVAGFHYAIGYFVPGPQTYAYSNDALGVTTSFGTVARTSTPLSFNASSLVGYKPTHHSMRITTAAP